MKHMAKRSLSLLLALAMCLSLLTGIRFTASAADAAVEYRYGSTSQYSNCTNVIYNWGSRGTTATFLSPNAQAFYEDNGTSYSALSALSGASDVDSVPSSPLYLQLQTLMEDNHSFQSNFDQTNDMYAFTDCQANNVSYVSCLYCGHTLTSDWNSGVIWQREHTWPQSKSLNGGELQPSSRTDETDIMMLRPACPNENQSRSNTAYGESSGYFTPNKFVEMGFDTRGDVARSVLYGYVRWGNSANMWGSDGVIESVDVLLKWMEEDPVDTWEMGRNDSVESITGTRNVFIDFPELAFLLFGEEIPENYTSASNGIYNANCTHGSVAQVNVVAADCTQSGYSGETVCTDCSAIIATGESVAATGHSYVNGNCTGCGLREATGGGTDFTLITAATAQAGNYIIGAVRGETYPTLYPATAKIDGTSDVDWYVSETKIEVQNDTVNSADLPLDAQIITLTGDNETGFTVGFMSEGVMKYVGYTSTTTSRRLALDEAYSDTLWRVVDDPDGGVALICDQGNYSICQNSTTTAAIRGYFDAKMYTGIYLFREAEPQVKAVASVNGTEYASFAEAYAACGEDQHIKLLDDSQIDLTLTKDLYIDLNGFTLTGSMTPGSYQIYGTDSVTDGYDAQTWGYLNCTGIDDAAVAPENGQYLALKDQTQGWSFHRYSLELTHITLKPNTVGIGYKAVFRGDSAVLSALDAEEAFGYSLTLDGGPTVTRYLAASALTSGRAVTLRIDNYDVNHYADTGLSAQVSIRLADGGVITTEPHTTTFKTVVETVNDSYQTLSDEQISAVATMIANHQIMQAWNIGNLYSSGS